MFKKIKRYAKDPYYSFGYYIIKTHPKWMTDRYYIKVLWHMLMGYKLNLKNPQTFNEKLQWLKLYDRNPLYPTLVDKYRVKQWVASKIGEKYVIPTIAVYKSVDEIDLRKLPDQFVLKCNHDSGSVIICRDKEALDFDAVKQKLNNALKNNFYWEAREWAYKHINRLVFAEKHMVDTLYAKDLLTYKFLCFEGEPYIMYITVKNDNIFENYYNMHFEPLDIHRKWPNSTTSMNKPKCFEEMKRIARVLSHGLKHVRIDLYEVNGQVYFSEFTFYDWAGFFGFSPQIWDSILGEKINIGN